MKICKVKHTLGINSMMKSINLHCLHSESYKQLPCSCTAQAGLKCLSHTLGSHSVCAVRTLLGDDRKILSIPGDCWPFHFCLITLFIPTWGKSSKHLDWEKHSAWVGYLLMEKIFQSTPNKVLTVQLYWVIARCATKAFSTTCTVQIEDCESWWLPSCHSSVMSTGCTSQVSYVQFLVTAWQSFHFPLLLPYNV